MNLALGLTLGIDSGLVDSTPGGSSNTYVRFGGTFVFRRPDGSSLYLRP